MESKDLKNAAREMLAKIPIEVKREIIAKSRWTCESNWMMALVLTSGWDVANRMNIQVGQAVGKAEMHRLMKALGIERSKKRYGIHDACDVERWRLSLPKIISITNLNF